jgi:microcystin-dependent protein
LNEGELPNHTHHFVGINVPGTRSGPGVKQNRLLANSSAGNLYNQDTQNLVQMNEGTCGGTGNNAPHNNIQPSLVLNFVIALKGDYPDWN